MRIEANIPALRQILRDLRAQHTHSAKSARIALVPTMGNLHAGHLSLVNYARQQADVVVVSIFVNPLQFGPTEDFAHYPRTLAADTAWLEKAGVDVVFAPQVEDLYPAGTADTTQVSVPKLSQILCGAARPGHFDGVSSVVVRLFNAVQPDLAVFGNKDYQQLQVIRRMTNELLMPINIKGLATHREADGLAMSSRNAYMNAQERALAPQLYQTLNEMKRALCAGEGDFSALEETATHRLTAVGFKPDYVVIRRCADLQTPQAEDAVSDWVILAAAWMGKTRLIDNLTLAEDTQP